jgi:hypothetical protein
MFGLLHCIRILDLSVRLRIAIYQQSCRKKLVDPDRIYQEWDELAA